MATEKRLDLISRRDLIKAVESKRFTICDNTHPYEAIRIQGKYFREVVDNAPQVDAVEVVHSRFVNVADFGDGEGCFGYCERCGTIHHAQHPVALKADYRWCRWCGAKMDGDGNG